MAFEPLLPPFLADLGTALSFQEPSIAVVEQSFCIIDTDKAPAGHTIYKVQFQIKTETAEGIPILQECEIWKRYSDFQQLAKQLEVVHQQFQPYDSTFPSLAKASYFGRFKDSVIEERRVSAEALLQFASSTPVLSSSSNFLSFIKSAEVVKTAPLDIPPQSSTITVSRTNSRNPSPSSSPQPTSRREELYRPMSTSRGASPAGNGDMQQQQQPDLLSASNLTTERAASSPTRLSSSPTRLSSSPTNVDSAVTSLGVPTHSVGLENSPLNSDSEEEDGTNREGIRPSLSRIGSVFVSEWGVEHTLKLKEEEGENSSAMKEVEQDGIHTSPPNDGARAASSSNLPEPTIASIPEGESSTAAQRGEGTWWSQALAETRDIDDFDSLIDNIDSTPKTTSSSSKPISDSTSHACSSSPFSLSPSSIDFETDGHRQLASEGKSKSPSPFSDTSPRDRRTSPAVDSGDYVVQAGKLISQGLQFEIDKDYKEALDLFKAGVDVLLNGVQTDTNISRRDAVRNKTAEYIQYAEQLQQKLSYTTGPPKTKSLGPVSASSKPHLLPDFKMVQPLADKVLLVQSRHNKQRFVFKVLYKTLPKQSTKVAGRLPRSKNRAPAQCPYMVQLLHHYETQTNRIFLLLEYVKGSRLVDHVFSLRHLHKKNEVPSETVPDVERTITEAEKSTDLVVDRENSEDSISKTLAALEVVTMEPIGSDAGEDEEDEPSMDRMLEELMSIETPTNRVGKGRSRRRRKSPDPRKEPEDSLTRRRRLLMETLDTENDQVNEVGAKEPVDHRPQVGDSEASGNEALINVIPPTPTTPKQSTDSILDDILPSPTISPSKSSTSSLDDKPAARASAHKTDSNSRRSSGQNTPQFSPGSLRNSPEPSLLADDVALQLESAIRQWAAQIVVALEHLHANGIVYQDLHTANILLNDKGEVRLTYMGKWDYVNHTIKHGVREKLYVAPELYGLQKATPAADWWSMGAILFELLTGKALVECHPGGVHSHIPITIPTAISPEAKSLLLGLLQVNPVERIGCGLGGTEDLKSHPFFQSVDWSNVVSSAFQTS